MRKYQMQVRLSYYVWVDVEAEDDYSARDQAVRRAWREMDKQQGCWGEDPEVLDAVVLTEGETQ